MSILNLSFNQPTTHLSCCTELGDIVYSLENALEKQLDNKRGGGVGIQTMFRKTNIFFLVGGGANPFISRDMFVMWDDKKKAKIFEVNMNEQIKNLRVVDDRLVVVLEKKLTLFNFQTGMSALGTKITYANPSGICVVNKSKDNLVIATLGSKKGEIAIWIPANDTYQLIPAHQNSIEALAISADGSLVATASDVGTVVKVFSTESLKIQYTFRRGSTTAKIHDLAFNNAMTVLAGCSSNGTLHFWDLYEDVKNTKNTQSSLNGMKNILPDFFSSQWAFKQIALNTTSKMICSFDEKDKLHIAAWDGQYYKIDGENYNNVVSSLIAINGSTNL